MEDYLSCCRLCLSPCSENLDLFGVSCMAQMIPQKILCVLSILVHPQDSMPQQICPSCLLNVKQFYKFHRTSSCSTAHLLTFLEKDEDITKNVYSNMIKAFQKKNYANLAGDKSYESLLQEKFDEVKNSVYNITSRFLDMKKNSSENLNPVVVITPSSSHNGLDTKVETPAVSNIVQSTTPTKTSKTSKDLVGNEPQIPHHSKFTRRKILRKSGGFQKNYTLNTKEIKEPVVKLVQTKIESLKLFRCKHCDSAYPTRNEALRHESSAHKCVVKLNNYYGPNHLQLEEDCINQIKKLSWPFRKRRYFKSPSEPKIITKTSIHQKDITLDKEVHNKSTTPRKRPLEIDDVNLAPDPPKRIRKAGPKSKTFGPSISLNFNLDKQETPPLVSALKKKRVGPKSKCFTQQAGVREKLYFEQQCKYCKYEFDSNFTSRDFLKHLNTELCNSITPYTCTLCREDFTGKPEKFQVHKENCCMTNYFSQELICSKCRQLVESSSLEDHLVDVHTTLFKCCICSSKFNEKGDLLDHLLKCTFKPTIHKTFTCATCRVQFSSLKDLKYHTVDKHTNQNLNCEKLLSLDYSRSLDCTELKKTKTTCNVLRYQIDNYKSCNSKGRFFCGIKECKKVLNAIFDLETHVQGHCVKGRKKKEKGKGKRKKQTISNNDVYFSQIISLCDDLLMKKKLAELPKAVEETVEPKAKDSFLSYFGLKFSYEHQEEREAEVNIMLDNLGIKCPAQDSQGIFELSSNARSVLAWGGRSVQKDSNPPEIVTIDDD